MKRVALVQAHHTDILRPDTHCLTALKDSGIFDEIVVIAADIHENETIERLAAREGVQCYLGHPDDMVSRMCNAVKITKADILARVLLYWFYVDINLINRQMWFLEKHKLDYAPLPYNFDIRFGADVFSARLVEKLHYIFMFRLGFKDKYQFRPWWLMESNPFHQWNVNFFEDVPVYSDWVFGNLQKSIKQRCPIAWDYGPGFHHHEYLYAREYLQPTDRVLDVGCGWGEGTKLLSEKCQLVIGTDIDQEYIAEAGKRHPQISFMQDDALDMVWRNKSFDVIVSVHMMEHLKDDEQFLREVKRVLKPGGRLIGEVPLKMQLPFAHTDKPFGWDHAREYRTNDLVEFLSKHFDVKSVYGANRGFYVDAKKARNAVGFVCQKE